MLELPHGLDGSIEPGLIRAAEAIAFCLGVVVLCRWHAVRIEQEAAISIVRGLVQILLVGVVLALLLQGDLLIGIAILLSMTAAAAAVTSRSLPCVKGSMILAFWAISAGSGVAIAGMIATGSLQTSVAVLVPVGSVIIANAKNACARAAERFKTEVATHVGQIEAGLALGAEPSVTVAPYAQSAIYAGLLPSRDMLKSLGLVSIPGVMAGMMVSGSSPIYASIYQFIIVAMILTASGITSLVITLLLRSRVFSPAAQLEVCR